MKLKIILTGATGMVGEGVLHECLLHPGVKKVLIINRRPSGIRNDKLEEMIVADFSNFSLLADRLKGYDACFFCSGVSSVGKKESEYTALTYTLTMTVAKTLADANPGMTFCYISGAGTDSSEKGRLMWARVKGKTENDLLRLPFKEVYAFRPGFIRPTKGLKNTLTFYKYVDWMFPFLNLIASRYISTLRELGVAMINAVSRGYEKRILEVKDIVRLAKQ